jgi:flagellar M-ring protein FliF
VRNPRGQLRRVSAAVIVNHKKGFDRAGKPRAQPFSDDELAKMQSLVRDAMGYSQQRGDSVSVVNIPFNVEAPQETPFYREPSVVELAKEAARFALVATVIGLVVLGVVRPILFPKPEPKQDEVQRLDEEFDEKIKAELAALTPQAREKRRLEIELERERRRLEEEEERMRQDEERARLEEERKRAEEDKQREYEELLAYARDYVQKDPRVVAAIFKDWLSDARKAPSAEA